MALEQFGEAVMVAAEVIDEDVAALARVADVTESVGLATEDVDVAVALIEMEMLNTLLTFLAVQWEFVTTTYGHRLSAQDQQARNQYYCSHLRVYGFL